MKVIDLLNKIANGEEVPKKIKYNIFELKRTMSNNLLRLYVDEEGMFFPEYYNGLVLNDEVEIIEEEKKIPEKIPLNYADDRKPEEVYEYLRCSYNQLIDYLKSKGE